MKFRVQSVGYSYDTKEMAEYKEKLVNSGINVFDFMPPVPEDSNYWLSGGYILVDINSAEDFVKITDAVGEVIFDGDIIKIYDDYYE